MGSGKNLERWCCCFNAPTAKKVFSFFGDSWPHFSLGEGGNQMNSVQQKWPEETENRCVMQKDAKTEFAQQNKTCSS